METNGDRNGIDLAERRIRLAGSIVAIIVGAFILLWDTIHDTDRILFDMLGASLLTGGVVDRLYAVLSRNGSK